MDDASSVVANDIAQLHRIPVPPGVARKRWKPPTEIELPKGSDVPFVGRSEDPPQKQLREYWVARVKVFRLPDDEEEYAKKWQDFSDDKAIYCHHVEQWDERNSQFVALLRWYDIDIKLPEHGTSPV